MSGPPPDFPAKSRSSRPLAAPVNSQPTRQSPPSPIPRGEDDKEAEAAAAPSTVPANGRPARLPAGRLPVRGEDCKNWDVGANPFSSAVGMACLARYEQGSSPHVDVLFYKHRDVEASIARCAGLQGLQDACLQAASRDGLRLVSERLEPQGLFLHRRLLNGRRYLFTLFTDQRDFGAFSSRRPVLLLCDLIEEFLRPLTTQRERQLRQLRNAYNVAKSLSHKSQASEVEQLRLAEVQAQLRNLGIELQAKLYPRGARVPAEFVEDGIFLMGGETYFESMSVPEEVYRQWREERLL